MAEEDRYKLTPEQRKEATELFSKFATGDVLNRDQLKEAFVSAGLKVRESEIDSLIVESEDSRRGVPESEDSSAENITLSEFIDLLRRKKLRDEAMARQAKQYLDKYDKNSDGKLTKVEVPEGMVAYLDDDGCLKYIDPKNILY